LNKNECGLIAQLVEQLTLNQLVGGSSPPEPIKKQKIKSSAFCYKNDSNPVGSSLSQNVTFSHLLFGRVPEPIKKQKIKSSAFCYKNDSNPVGSSLSQNVTFSHLLFGRVPEPIKIVYVITSQLVGVVIAFIN
jgi:hypothetical protein